MQNKYADIIIDITHENVDRPFTYAVPEKLRTEVYPGCPVLVPFANGKKDRRGYITALREETEVPEEKLKEISGIAEKDVSAVSDMMVLAGWMHTHYGCMLNQALKTVLPVKQRVKRRKTREDAAALPFPEEAGERQLTLNPDQENAVRRFSGDWEAGIRKTYLLYGITGSGKTEVYMEMIRRVLQDGKQAILLVPEISLTYQTVQRLKKNFGDEIAIINSRLSQGEKFEEFDRARNGRAGIMVGPRSAVFAPFPALGLIIMDEEHDSAYKNDTVPRYETRDVAIRRAEISGASVVLGSATPSPASWALAAEGKYTLLELTRRAVNGAELARTHIVDLREELKSGNRSVFSRKLKEMMEDRLSRGEQTILFMNRRGYSNFVSCRSCGNAIRCPHCDVTLTLHADGMLRCHYCGYELPLPEKCPDCGSPYLAGFGTGTQKLETLTRKMFPSARVLRMDADAASRKNAGRDILSDFASGKADILIGTQMVVKGHDLSNVTLVGIMAADTELYVSAYDSAERTFELITQAAGRAGRGKRAGDVVIQTYRPDHYAIRNAADQDYRSYIGNEMAYRKVGAYPPAVHILTVQLASADEETLRRAASLYAVYLKAEAEKEQAMLIGPARAGIYKIHDYFRKMIYIKHISYDILLGIKNRAENSFKEKAPAGISVLYDFT